MQSITETIEATARRDGRLDFKYEGKNSVGLPFGKLSLHSSGDPVFPDGRWVTKHDALQLALAWGVEVFES